MAEGVLQKKPCVDEAHLAQVLDQELVQELAALVHLGLGDGATVRLVWQVAQLALQLRRESNQAKNTEGRYPYPHAVLSHAFQPASQRVDDEKLQTRDHKS